MLSTQPILRVTMEAEGQMDLDDAMQYVPEARDAVTLLHQGNGGCGLRLCEEALDGQKGVEILQADVHEGIVLLLRFTAINPRDPQYLMKNVEQMLKKGPCTA